MERTGTSRSCPSGPARQVAGRHVVGQPDAVGGLVEGVAGRVHGRGVHRQDDGRLAARPPGSRSPGPSMEVLAATRRGRIGRPGNTRRRSGKLVSSRHRVLQQAAPSLLQKALSSWAHCLAGSRVDPDSLADLRQTTGRGARRGDGLPFCLTSTRPEAPGMGAQRRVGRDDVTLSRLHRGHRRGRPALSTGRTIMLSAVSPLLVGRRTRAAAPARPPRCRAGRPRAPGARRRRGRDRQDALSPRLRREADGQRRARPRRRCYDLTETPPYGPWRDLAPATAPWPTFRRSPASSPTRTDRRTPAARRRSSPRCATSSPPWPPSAPCSCCWRTCTGPTPPASTCCASSPADWPTVPLLLLATYRADELTRRHPLYHAPARLVREARADRLDLRPLDEAASARAGRGALPRCPTPTRPGWSPTCQAHAEGNPFYAERAAAHAGGGAACCAARRNGWVLGRPGARCGVPPLLRQVIDGAAGAAGRGRRGTAGGGGGDRAGGAARRLGRRSADWRRTTLLPTVERAVEAQLLEAARRRGRASRFAHALIREALYEGILPLRRRPGTAQVGEALADLARARPRRGGLPLPAGGRRAGGRRGWCGRGSGRSGPTPG